MAGEFLNKLFAWWWGLAALLTATFAAIEWIRRRHQESSNRVTLLLLGFWLGWLGSGANKVYVGIWRSLEYPSWAQTDTRFLGIFTLLVVIAAGIHLRALTGRSIGPLAYLPMSAACFVAALILAKVL